MQLVHSLFSLLKNKYFVSLVIFGVIILFTDHNNLFEQMERKQELKELRDKKKYYEDEITRTRKQLADLSNSSAAIEKYAREKFYMKKDNEDVFLIDNRNDSLKK